MGNLDNRVLVHTPEEHVELLKEFAKRRAVSTIVHHTPESLVARARQSAFYRITRAAQTVK